MTFTQPNPSPVADPLQLTFTKPHILLLDEPSNHLDIDAVNALIEGLATFKGGVLMVCEGRGERVD